MKIKNTKITIIQKDITQIQADALVREDSALENGSVRHQKAQDVKAEYFIDVPSIDNELKTDEIRIREAAAGALACADSLKLKSIVWPGLGSRVGGFAPLGSAKIMAQEVMKYLRREEVSLREIIFCLSDKELHRIFKKGVTDYIEYMLHKMSQGPYATVDAIIELKEGLILIERSNPPFGWALPGGFVDYGESLEDAVVREAKEETSVDFVDIRQFHVYSRPDRDPRFHTIATVFIGKGKGQPHFGDDAKGLKVVKYKDLLDLEYAFDHKEIIRDYLKARK